LFAAGLSLAGLAFSTWLEDAGVPARVTAALDEHQPRIGRPLQL
jgi:hypothetical protein